MGGSASAVNSNDELIDHLVEAEFIKTPLIQRVFRAVDRGNYFVSSQKFNAYKDMAWKMGNLHLSAPCVYSVVMEALKLRAGLSFLNLGSGSGYLSTMAGLVLGPYGVNHGVELNSDLVDFAYERLDDFMKNSPAVDEYEFCEPTFMVGDCLKLDDTCQQYDRVYCGASCPAEYELYFKNLIKVGGILILPLNEKLLKITRVSETRWNAVKVLSVSFAPLMSLKPGKEPTETVKLGDISPPKLQHLCRSYIRTFLRRCIDDEHPNLKLKQLRKERQPRKQVQKIVIPFYDDSDESNSGENTEIDSDGSDYTISSRLPSRMSVFLEEILRRHTELQLWGDMEEQINLSNSGSDSDVPGPSNPPILPNANKAGGSETEPENQFSNNLLFSNNELFPLIAISDITASSSSSDEYSMPLRQLPHNRRKLLKRKRGHSVEKKSEEIIVKRTLRANPSNNSKAGTSSGAEGKPRKKTRRTAATVVWKKHADKRKIESKEEVSDEENYSGLLVARIGALPLPSAMLRYLNYKRENL